jgi:hypothetical protein
MVSKSNESFFGLPVIGGLAALAYNAIIHIWSTEGKWQYVTIFLLLISAVFLSRILQEKLPEAIRGNILPLMIIGLGLAVGGYAHYALQKGLLPYLFVILGTGYFISGGMRMIDRL